MNSSLPSDLENQSIAHRWFRVFTFLIDFVVVHRPNLKRQSNRQPSTKLTIAFTLLIAG